MSPPSTPIFKSKINQLHTLTTNSTNGFFPGSYDPVLGRVLGVDCLTANRTLKIASANNILQPTSQISVACYVYPTQFCTNTNAPEFGLARVFWKSDISWGPYYDIISLTIKDNGSGHCTITTSDNNLISTPDFDNNTFKLNTWHHFGLSYDGSLLKAYLNGEIISQISATGSLIWRSNGAWRIGNALDSSGCQAFSGLIADTRICDIARPTEWFASAYKCLK